MGGSKTHTRLHCATMRRLLLGWSAAAVTYAVGTLIGVQVGG